MTRVRRPTRVLATLLPLAVAVQLGCAAPIWVERTDAATVHRQLTRSVLTDGELSLTTENYLRRANLARYYRSDPEEALRLGFDLIRTQARYSSPTERAFGGLVALAEMCFQHASRGGDRSYYLAAAIYAWLYLQGEGRLAPHALDLRVRLAANLYNRGITLAFLDPDKNELVLRSGVVELPFGRLEIELDESELSWQGLHLARFTPVADLEIHGIRNRYLHSGIGAPLAAAAEVSRVRAAHARIPRRIEIPVTALLVFEDLRQGFLTGSFRGRFRIFAMEEEAEIDGRTLPLESEPTASLALTLVEARPWRDEISGFFQTDLPRVGDGLSQLAPYQPGRIPVILVHGTASSAGRWADFLNDLRSDAEISRNFQFWLFTYNSGQPIAYSGYLLREAIADMVAALDPDGRDPALRRIVVVGHSQGGLLAKLTAVDSGDLFWSRISDRPLSALALPERSRELLEGALFVRPSPFVTRVVFIATPHRGSYVATFAPARLLARFVRAPAVVGRLVGDLVEADPESVALRRIDDVQGAIGNMSPTSPFIRDLASLPVAPGVHSHSIIAVEDFRDRENASDGVVRYDSAHVDGVDSEVVVLSGHSCQSHPMVIEEARRILLDHLGPGRRR